MSQGKKVEIGTMNRVLALSAAGESIRAIAKTLQMSKNTVNRILKEAREEPDLIQLSDEYKKHVTTKWLHHSERLLDSITPEVVEKMSGRDRFVAAGIATDKGRLWGEMDRGVPKINNFMLNLFGSLGPNVVKTILPESMEHQIISPIEQQSESS